MAKTIYGDKEALVVDVDASFVRLQLYVSFLYGIIE